MRAPTLVATLVARPCGRRLARPRRRPAFAKCPRPSGVSFRCNTKLRYTTMIVLPDDEEILDVVCGDRDFWVISATQNIAHVKPAKEGAATNLNLVTASGTVYSFLLTEGKSAQPDLKVYVTADPTTPRGQAEVLLGHSGQRAPDRADRGARRRRERAASHARKRSRASDSNIRPRCSSPTARPSTRSRSSSGRSGTTASSPTSSRTRASCRRSYELKDGQPSLVNFQVQSGTYVVPKVLERGYLALGKDRFSFQQGR